MNGRFFEDFAVDDIITTRARTINEADVVAFAGLSGDFNSLHMDAVFARSGPFGERIAHGLLGLSIVSGLMEQTGLIERTVVAFLGLDWSFRAPIRFGDTLAAQLTVESKRETSNPDRGIVVLGVSVTNQRDDVVQVGTFTLMMRRRPVATEQGGVSDD